MIHLREILLRDGETRPTDFPFNLEIIKGWAPLSFESPVTILVGENGSGKSTVLEGIACAAEMITVGSGAAHRDTSLSHVHDFSKWPKLVLNQRTRRVFPGLVPVPLVARRVVSAGRTRSPPIPAAPDGAALGNQRDG